MKKVLLLDSGVGGLSVLDELLVRLPGIQYSYILDNGYCPYGDKSEVQLKERSLWLLKNALGRMTPDLLVVACNTLSTLVLPELRSRWSFPIVGVVPAIKPAAQMSLNKSVGLLATPATVARPYTKELVDKFASHCDFRAFGSMRLVELAERKLSGESVCLKELAKEVEPLFRGRVQPDTVVLGCTHFPLLRRELKRVCPTVNFVDSGASIAARVKTLLGPHESCTQGGVVYLTEQSNSVNLTENLKRRRLENLVIIK